MRSRPAEYPDASDIWEYHTLPPRACRRALLGAESGCSMAPAKLTPPPLNARAYPSPAWNSSPGLWATADEVGGWRAMKRVRRAVRIMASVHVSFSNHRAPCYGIVACGPA